MIIKYNKIILSFISLCFAFSCQVGNLYRFEYLGKYGFVDEKYEIVIPPKYDFATQFNGHFAVVKENLKYKIINQNDEKIFDSNYDRIYSYNNGYVIFKEKGLFGICDLTGHVIIANCVSLEDFSDGLAAVEIGKQNWNFIDKQGKFVFPENFSFAASYSEGLAAVRDPDTDKWGFIDKDGIYKIPPMYDDVSPNRIFESGHCIVEKDNNALLINKQNKDVLNLGHTISFIVGPDLIAVGTNDILAGNYKLITFQGVVIKEDFANTISSFSEGFAFFESRGNGKYGIIDSEGNFFYKPVFEESSYFYNGKAFIIKDGQGGFIDTKGEIVWVRDFIKRKL